MRASQMRASWMRIAAAASPLALATAFSAHAAEKPMRFWNLTSATVTELRFAPAGSAEFGADQCKNDKDGSVDHDERLPLAGLAPGRYDVKVGYKNGRTCRVANVAIERGGIVAVEDKDLKDCSASAR